MVLRFKRSGFTLVELLVVILIVGILAAVLIPAVLGTRESARKTLCANHQSNVAKAILQYEMNKGVFPGYANRVPGYDYEAGWPVAILKLIDREDVWKAFREGTIASDNAPRIDLYLCPSDPEAGGSGPSLSYAGNCGQPDGGDDTVSVEGQTEYLGIVGEKVPPDWSANGVFFRRFSADTSDPAKNFTQVQLRLDEIADGAGHTFLTSECYGDGIADVIVNGTPRGAAQWNANPAMENYVGFLWSQESLKRKDSAAPAFHVSSSEIINQDAPLVVASGEQSGREVWVPTGYHPGGVNVSYCDGRVTFLAEGVSYVVYALQMTPNGANVWLAGTAKSDDAGDPPDWCKEALPKD